MPSVATLYIRLKADTRDYHRKLDRAMKGMRKFSKRTTAMGTQMSMKLTAPLLLAAGAMTKFSIDMNKGMADVATLIPGNIARIEELKASVQRLAIETGKSTTDMAAGLYQVVSAFGDSAESAKRLEIVSKAAAAGGATTTDALNLLSAMTKGYGDTSAKAMEQAADLAFQIVKLGQTTFPELAASMGRSIPLAASLGVEMEELAAGYATLTGVTGSAAEVSSQLAALIRAMIKQTTGMSKAIATLGYETAQEMIKTEGLVGGLRKLINTTDGTQEAITKLFGRAEALVAVFALTEGQMITFDEKMLKMMKTGGAMREAFGEQTEGINRFGHALNVLKIRMLVLAQRMGDRLAPVFETLLAALEPVLILIEQAVEWFEKLDMKWQVTIIAAAGLVTALGPAILAFGLLMKGILAIIPVIGALFSPLGLVVAAMAAIAAVTYTYRDEIVGFFKGIYEGAKKWVVKHLGKVWEWLGKALADVVEQFRAVWEVFRDMMKWVGVDLPALANSVKEFSVHFAETAEEIASTTVATMGDTFRGLVDKFQLWWAELQESARKAGEDTNDAVGESTDAMTGIVKKHFEETAESGKDMFSTLKDAGEDWTTSFEDSIVEFVQSAKLQFHDLANSIIEDLIRINVQAARTDLWKFLGNVAASIGGGGSGGGGGADTSSGSWIPGGPVGDRNGMLSVGGPAVVVNDNRGANAPPVDVSKGGGGSIVLTITDAVLEAGYGGRLDKMMSHNFGVSRQAIGR